MESLQKKNLLAAQYEYAAALTYFEMFHSDACWKTVNVADNPDGTGSQD